MEARGARTLPRTGKEMQMKTNSNQSNPRTRGWGRVLLECLAAMALLIILAPGGGAGAGAETTAPASFVPTNGSAPLVQQFEDVPDSNPFSTYINSLYLAGIVSG